MKATIKDTELFYTTHGQGRPMLVLHGGPGLDHTYFRPWLDGLGSRVELIYYDQRGNGRSIRPKSWENVDHQTWIEDADALRAHLGHEKILLFGHSYGGFLAQEYAVRYGEHLDGLILVNTAPVMDYAETAMAGAEARGTPEQLDALRKAFSGQVADNDAFREVAQAILPLYFHGNSSLAAEVFRNTAYSAGAYNHAMLECLPRFNTLDRLGEIRTPTLVMTGRSDWAFPPAHAAERIHMALPDSELVIFERSGHLPFVEEPDAFTAAVIGWLDRHHA